MEFFQSRFNPKIKVSQIGLLEVGQKISREYMPNATSAFPELVLLPVDPFHLYAYWNLGEIGVSKKPNDFQNLQLTLRVYCRTSQKPKFFNNIQWLDVAVNHIQHQREVEVPNDGKFYSAMIGKLYPDQSFLAYAYSNVVHTPRSGVAKVKEDENELIAPIHISEQQEVEESKKLNEQSHNRDTKLDDFINKDNLFAEGKKTSKMTKSLHELTSDKHYSGLGIK